MEVDGEGAKHR